MKPAVKIDVEYIQDQINYWESSMIYYVVGPNPPFSIMEGLLRRIWAKKGIEKIVVVNKGIFLVRFHSIEQRDVIQNEVFQFFDKKPLIMKKWHVDMDFKNEELKL